MQGSSCLSALPSISGLSQSTLPNFGQTSNMQSVLEISQSCVNNSLVQGATPDIYASSQRQIQARPQQQKILSQQQQQQSQNPHLYQNQLQPQLMKQKINNNALLQQPIQQQQSLLQANQLQPSQQIVMPMSSGVQSGQLSIQQSQPTTIQSAPQSDLQQNQLNLIQQSLQSLLPENVQAIARQPQQAQSSMHQQASLQQQSSAINQHSSLQTQQQQLIGKQANMSNMSTISNMPNMSNMSSIQQNQMLRQHKNIVDIKQQQQHKLPVQQNNPVSMQQSLHFLNRQTLSLHQQQQLGQQNNLQGLQQQLGQQNNLQGLQQQSQTQAQQLQQQLLVSRPNVSDMQHHQHSMLLLQQSKNLSESQQQLQQPCMTMLQSQDSQSHHQSSQQQLMSQFQSQSGHLQHPSTLQQQPNSMQREMQKRLQASGALLQSQNAMEQQKQFMQSQRGIPEVSSSTSMDSTAWTGRAYADWQGEVYYKIQAMKEAHLAELQEFHQKFSQKFKQHDMMPHAKQSENYEKLRNFKLMLERMIGFLKISKNSITIALKENFPMYEKHIVSLVSSSRKKIISSEQQGQQQFQHPGAHAQSTTQHQPSQVLHMQQHDNHGNQVQQMNMPGSITSMQSAAASTIQHGSLSLSSVPAPTTQQSVTNSMQSTATMDPVQVNSFGSLKQRSMGPLQNLVIAAQQTHLNCLSQNSMSALQPNVSSMQNSSVLQQQNLKQHHQEHMLPNQQLKQQFQHLQIQQVLQQQARQQLLHLQQPLHQQKKQQVSQLPAHQMSHTHPITELYEQNARQGSVIKPGLYQQPYEGGQHHNYYHQQLKPGTSFSFSSPQNLQASTPQISHHSLPQIDLHTLLPTLSKTGSPMQSTGSPLVVPSPSTPIVPSPIPGDSEKLVSNAISLPATGQITHQQASSLPPRALSMSIATPGISTLPLLAEFTSQEGNIPNGITSRTSASNQPLEYLIKAVQSLSPNVLGSAVSDIASVVSMIDRIAGSASGNGSKTAVREDLVAMTKCHLQERNFMLQDGGATTKKIKRHISAMPLNNISSAGSASDNFMQFSSLDSMELESTTYVRRHKLKVNHALLEEIMEINQQLIDTVLSICDEDSDSVAAASVGGEGTIVKCSFSAVALSPSLKACFASMHASPVAPLRLLVPANYPKCAPLLLDKLPVEPSKEFEDLSMKAKSRFSISLCSLSQPMSLGEMARTWDTCARKVILEYAQQTGGGSFSSTYGAWENCVGA